MKKEYTIFIFRRDLRLIDNKGLDYAMNNHENILPIFIFTPEQVTDKNKFKSDNAIQFMIESLKELNNNLIKKKSRLHLFYGDNIKILQKIIKRINIKNIVFNMDYTVYARNRDKKIKLFCEKNKINCYIAQDYLLKDIGSFNKIDGSPYLIFSPFRNNGIKQKIDKPIKSNIKNLTKTLKVNTLDESDYIKYNENKNILVHGGRSFALKILNKIKEQKKYNKNRNMLHIQTTLLSAPIKFGCISIREVYWKIKDTLGNSNDLISQLFWREFYYYIAYYFPKVLQGKNYNTRYDKMKWSNNPTFIKKWINGLTGYPIVDAGMIELNITGYMHNRARLITANFLNRMLDTDWTIGEKLYAKLLTDYDPSVNNGNWQWIASTGVDPKPYFQRLFNPWIQSKKFDKDAKYIKKWLPQLKDIPANELHTWDKYYDKYDLDKINYVKPIVNYKEARKKSIKLYRKY